MRTPPLSAIWLALCALLPACSLPRPPAQVDPGAPGQWSAPLPASAALLPHGGSLALMADWWRQLDDPVLVSLIEAAETASPTAASARTRIEEARASRVAAGAALAPTLNASLSASRSNAPSTGTPGTSSTQASTDLPVVTTLQAGLQSSWEIDLFGGLRATREAGDARLAGADARWHDARISVAAETANAYFGDRACRRQLAVSVSDADSRAETARLTGLSMRAGFTSAADAALARASAAEAAARLNQQRAQCAVQVQALVALTGLDVASLQAKLDAAPVDAAPAAVRAIHRVPADALAQRPDVYAAELAVAAASADAGAALAQRFPKLTLQGSIDTAQLRTGNARSTLDTWTIGPLALTVPIFDGGTRAANEAAAQARYEEAVALYRGSVRQAVREVEEALINLRSTDERAADADLAVQNYQASFNATQARYGSGLASLFELEEARRTLFASQTARVALQRERAQAWVSLYRSMGGGWSRPDAAATTRTSSVAPSP